MQEFKLLTASNTSRGGADRSPNMNYAQNKGSVPKPPAVLATKILGKSPPSLMNAGPQITHARSDTPCAVLPLFAA